MMPDYDSYSRLKQNFETAGLNFKYIAVELDFDEYPIQPLFFTKINGAEIESTKINALITIDQDKLIDGCYYGCTCTLEDGDKMGDFFKCLPYGIINKTLPGIGATTLELNSDRHSIIVVPTKSLAYTKYKTTEIERGKDSCMYVGSSIGNIKSDITLKDIKDYIKIENGKKKKFLVVADSLPKVLEAIGEDKYKNYFLMIDEIDTLQTDNTYRPALEKVIDYYALFEQENRAVVSATMQEFTHPELLKDTVITTCYRTIPSRNISLRHTNNEDLCVIETTAEILQKSPSDKIVIAYNSLDGILVCIELLTNRFGDEMRSEIGILCGEMSKEKAGDYYIEINDNNTLPKQIVFMTCAYFVGIDIEEKYHSIAISTFNQPFTLLSTNRLTQIVGRCRKGVFSETIIYTTRRIDAKNKFHEFKERILRKAYVFSKAIHAFKKVIDEAPELVDAEINYQGIINYFAYEKVNNDYPIKILRTNIHNEIVPSFFNIDALLERWCLHHSLFYEHEILLKELTEQGHNVKVNNFYSKYTEEQKAILSSVKKSRDEKLDNSLMKARSELMEWDQISAHEIKKYELEQLIKTSPKQLKKFYEGFKKFSPYFETEYLADLLIEHHHVDERKYRTFINSLVFWALDDKHPFKILVKEKFGYNVPNPLMSLAKPIAIYPEEKLNIMNNIFDSYFSGYPISDKVKKGLLKCFFKKSLTKRYEGIIALNPMDFKNPTKKISPDVSARELINLFELK